MTKSRNDDTLNTSKLNSTLCTYERDFSTKHTQTFGITTEVHVESSNYDLWTLSFMAKVPSSSGAASLTTINSTTLGMLT